MDIDRPLEDIISANKKPRGEGHRGGGGGGGRGGPRRSDRGSKDTPYARPPPRSTEDKWVHDAYQGPGRRSERPADAGRVAGTGAGFTGLSPRIEVVGLHYEVTPADLKTIFSQAGTLVQGPTIRPSQSRSLVCYDRSGRSRGEATMEFASPQQAKIAINKFDGAMTKGQTISIRLLPPAMPRGPPGAARGGASQQTGASLLSRIAGAPGAGRAPNAPQGGPARGRGAVRGIRGRGGPGRGRGGGARQPATGEDLDKQLDNFMAGENTGNKGDVEMA